MSGKIEKAAAYRDRAKQLRAIAEGPAEKMREALLILAKDFEHMAEALDRLCRR
jgi:hypothetical protein